MAAEGARRCSAAASSCPLASMTGSLKETPSVFNLAVCTTFQPLSAFRLQTRLNSCCVCKT